jgi:hypothetical protein
MLKISNRPMSSAYLADLQKHISTSHIPKRRLRFALSDFFQSLAMGGIATKHHLNEHQQPIIGSTQKVRLNEQECNIFLLCQSHIDRESLIF